MKFYEYFETINNKPVRFKLYPTEYIIRGGGSAWSLFKKVGDYPSLESSYTYIGFFANTFSETECTFQAAVLGKNVTVKVKIDDFKLIGHEKKQPRN